MRTVLRTTGSVGNKIDFYLRDFITVHTFGGRGSPSLLVSDIGKRSWALCEGFDLCPR